MFCSVLEEIIDHLIERTFIRATNEEDNGQHNTFLPSYVVQYVFDSSAIKACIYGLIPYTEKQRLHTQVANSLEKKFLEGNDTSLLAEISHHYMCAADYDSCFQYCERAYVYYLRVGLKEKALDSLLRGLKIVPECSFFSSGSYDIEKLAKWYMTAHGLLIELGRDLEAREIYEGNEHYIYQHSNMYMRYSAITLNMYICNHSDGMLFDCSGSA